MNIFCYPHCRLSELLLDSFFGTSGIFTKLFDLIFTTKKEERAQLIEIKAENSLLRKEVEKLRQEITILDKHLAENTIYMKTLLAWLEKAMPEGTNAFIAEMAREIREKNKIVH